jgi:hypothetical protein
VLDQPQDQVGRRDGGLDAEQLEGLEVPRVVDAGDDPVAEVLLLGDLADQQVVLVVARDRDDEVGALDARALEHPQLGRVAVLHGVLELLLDDQVAAALLLDQRDLVALLDELAGEVPADLAAAADDDVQPRRGPPRRPLELLDAICVGQTLHPCSPYQRAARDRDARETRRTSNALWAICATTRFVLSPFVQAMKTSASDAGSIEASTSSAVPIVKRPPASSQEGPPRRGARGERSLVEDGHGVAGAKGGVATRTHPAGAYDEDEHVLIVETPPPAQAPVPVARAAAPR